MTDTAKRRSLLKATFKMEVSDRAATVDTLDDLDWFSLTLGWALAKGLSPADAREFSTYIRYHTELG